MTEFIPRHLVIVRHGESEGDVRRASRLQGKADVPKKHPAYEGQTETGNEQSIAAGKWIAKHVLKAYGIRAFDIYATSPMLRAKQSALSLGLNEVWQEEPLLTERNRGEIQGFTLDKHKTLYPESFENMKKYPFHWVPPGGESILKVADRAEKFIKKFKDSQYVIAQTHRDWIWSLHMPLDGMGIEEVVAVNTDEIRNAQVLHYTNINPVDGSIRGDFFRWKRSVCPWSNDAEVDRDSGRWVEIKNPQAVLT